MKKIFTFIILFIASAFLTKSVNAQCTYTLELYDSWGDGWNGNTISVTVNSAPIAGSAFTLGNGFSNSINIPNLNSGDVIGLQFNAIGSFIGECSWSLFNSQGVLVYNQPATSPTNLQTFIAGCPSVSCAAPSALSATSITHNSATLNFTSNSTGIHIVEYGPAGFTPGTGTTIITSATSVNISGLNSNTNYQYIIQDSCSVSDLSAPASATFTTLPPPGSCNYNLTLFDSFGDGWNGNTIRVFINSSLIGTYTFTTGSTFNVPIIGVSNGAIVGIQFMAGGSFVSECSWSLFNSAGTLVHNQPATAPTTLQNFVGGCPSATCPAPSGLAATNITDTSATLNFTSNSPGLHVIEYGPAGFTPGTGTTILTLSTSVNIGGLSPYTNYQFIVQDSCGLTDVSLPVTSTFTTLPPYGSCNYNLTLFDSFGDGWNGNTISVFLNSNLVANYTFTTGTQFNVPIIGVVNGDVIGIQFNAGGSFIAECSWSLFNSEGTLVFNQPSTAPTVLMNFVGGCPNPNCPTPTALNATNITATSATLNWTPGAFAAFYTVEYGPIGFIPGTGVIEVVTNPTLNITNLTPNTDYVFYVQDSCGLTEVSSTAGPGSFYTPCATFIAPWFDNVESFPVITNGFIEDCWSVTPTPPNFLYRWNVTGTGVTPSTGSTGANFAYSGDKYFYTEASNGAFNAVAQLETPDVDITGLTTAALMFQYHFFGAGMGKLYIDIFDGTTWTNNIDSIIGQQQTSGAADWIFHTTDISSYTGVVNARFRSLRGGSFAGDMCIDDVRIDNIPTCFAPTNLIDSVIDPFTVSLAWTTGGASNWIIEYGPEGFTPGTGTFVSTASNPAIISGLTPGLDYDWYVQDSCSATDVSWQSTDGNFRMPNVVFCDSTNNFTYCHPDESIETYTYQSENGSGQLHVVFNSGTVASLVDFNIYDGPDATYPVLYSSTGGSNMANVEFTSASSIITMVHNSVSANPCTAPLDFDINCCVPTSSFQNIFICVDSSFTLADGTVVSNAGGYSAVIPNVLGCDSNITYILQFLPDTVSATDKLCAGEIYLFADGSSTNVPGQFQVTTSNMLGCDSTINYTIEGISPSSSNYVAEICQGDFYVMPNGTTVSTAGPHVVVIPNAVGCDSTITVNLIVRPHTFGAQNVTLCEGQTLELPDGVTASTAGQYTSLVTNYYGCDSTVTTNLSYASTSFGNVVIEICGEETYTLLNGDEVAEAGEYNISIDNAAGCDSIVTVYVSKCSAIDATTQDLLSIYPNPASSFVTIAFNEVMMNAMDLKIINAMGQTVYTVENVKDKSIKVNVENFADGLYFIVLNNKDQTSLHKFMISK